VGVLNDLGSRPVINACGIYTDLGGSILSPTVWAAMSEANATFADMVELLDGSGRVVAGLLETEAARVTPGASAAIALGTAACLAGPDGAAMERLPDTTGLRGDVLIQARHRYKYDRMVRLTGARLVEVGDGEGRTTERSLAAALDAHTTAALMLPAHLDGRDGTVPLGRSVALAHSADVPVLVDAAYLNFPPDLMRGFTAAGADLVCFSAKYFWGPNSGGIIAGRRDLIEAVAVGDFTRFESGRHLIFGRPYKMDRQTVVGVVLALQEWFAMDHEGRFAAYRGRVDRLRRELGGLTGIVGTPRCFTMAETYESEPVNCLYLEFDPAAANVSPDALDDILRAGDPSIRVILESDGVAIVVETLSDDDIDVVVERIAAALAR
jgi:D-glucosaminate-6-phosphate ammonia-lyase